jgi:FHS family glucose/mannose:H+ symporter-like MFS transporter
LHSTSNPSTDPSIDSPPGPSALWLALGFLLAGLGTVLLGPILPTLAHNWRLTDSQSGLLLAAKFTGAFLGGVTVPRRLRFGILGGMLFSCAGFGAFALSINLLTGCACLFVSGFGLGQIIAATNILAGRRYTAHTGSALAALNFFWSLGAVACGLIAAAVLPRFHLRGPLLTFAGLFLATGLGGLVSSRESLIQPKLQTNLDMARLQPCHQTAKMLRALAPEGTPTPPEALPRAALLHFSLLLFLYGGLETCMTGWLTTYTLRFSDIRLLGGQSALVLLWSALTFGRALSAAALRIASERATQRIGLALSAIFIAALTTTHHGPLLSLYSVLLGLSLAPFFPTTFALLMLRRPTAREAGFILAVSGLGAALFPWLMGFVSTHSGSLRIAMAVPFLLALALLLVSLRPVQPLASLSSEKKYPPST